ncbi:type II TA system antitoxin MqsA family protein [Acidovorax sp.]|uniref:type II TA system antitoxin MqsA family protein n=1 Tax=Acidovorax sp. TaxID=1872122 RepID=UPI003D049D5A
MKCAACGGNDLVYEERDVEYRYGKGVVVLAGLEAGYCPDCGEIMMKRDEAERYVTATRKLRVEVNTSVVSPRFIEIVRKKLGLNQAEADTVFSQPAGAFLAYERGIRPVPPLLVQLLKVLSNHPELLNEIDSPVIYPKQDWRSSYKQG